MIDYGKIGESFRSQWSRLDGAEASQMMEFAVALPLLVVLVIGIVDFGTAFNLKQELNNAVREGARFAATQPTNDLSNSGTPPSVNAVRSLVDSYLLASRINDCDLSTTTGNLYSAMTWTYTAKGKGCPSPYLVLTISRSIAVPATGYGNPNPINVNLVSTQVTIYYPYQWRFNRVITLLVPSANYAGVSQITTTAWAANMN